ncbi:MAG TPA: type VI secretion system tube protein Hcp [Geminicoccaceae bacterium]|nr:type VI secretion system tube protein Hcp [Geminicoccaceae bacterium]
MAVECFLKFEGPELKGESVGSEHTEEIDVLSWSWGASQSGTMHIATGGGAGKANVGDLTITKWCDKASPNLMQRCINGKHFEKATLTCRKAGGEAPIPYLKIEMEKVLITSVQTSGSGSEDRFMENVALNFATYKETYTPQKPDGTADSEVGPVGWKIAENAEP